MNNKETNVTNAARKLSTREARRSLVCRARQDVSTTLRNLGLLVLGNYIFSQNDLFF